MCAELNQHRQLINRLHSLNMIEFTLQPKVINGYFGVPKDNDTLFDLLSMPDLLIMYLLTLLKLNYQHLISLLI